MKPWIANTIADFCTVHVFRCELWLPIFFRNQYGSIQTFVIGKHTPFENPGKLFNNQISKLPLCLFALQIPVWNSDSRSQSQLEEQYHLKIALPSSTLMWIPMTIFCPCQVRTPPGPRKTYYTCVILTHWLRVLYDLWEYNKMDLSLSRKGMGQKIDVQAILNITYKHGTLNILLASLYKMLPHTTSMYEYGESHSGTWLNQPPGNYSSSVVDKATLGEFPW